MLSGVKGNTDTSDGGTDCDGARNQQDGGREEGQSDNDQTFLIFEFSRRHNDCRRVNCVNCANDMTNYIILIQ